MGASFDTRLRIASILTVLFCSVFAPCQTTQTASKSDSLAVSLKIEREQVQVGRTPWAVLTVYNTSDQPVIMEDTSYRVYVYGKDGEAPTTLIQRQLTGRLRPGDAPLNYTLNVATSIIVWPAGGAADWFDRKFQLAYLYDLSAPGRYTAYADIMDPSSHRWLRTKTVTFEMTASAE
jgi:uncharacterized protein YcfL